MLICFKGVNGVDTTDNWKSKYSDPDKEDTEDIYL